MNSLTRHLLSLLLFPVLLRAQPEAAYQVAAAKTVMVPMRDGIKLATDIYFPTRTGAAPEGRFPVILERTPYNKAGGSVAADHLVPHGYIVIFQATGVPFATIQTTDSIPLNGLDRSRGQTAASALWAVPTVGRPSMLLPSRTRRTLRQ
jgi:hypothetical protein